LYIKFSGVTQEFGNQKSDKQTLKL
jgi:hypothetical protein